MSQVPDFVGFLLEDVFISSQEGLNEQVFVLVIHRAEPLRQQAEETLIDPFDHAALKDHVDEFMLVPLGNVHLEHLVGTLLEVDSRLDCQVDGLPEVDQVLLSHVHDSLFLGYRVELFLVLLDLLESCDVLLPKDLHLDLLPLLLCLEVLRIQFEQIEVLFSCNLLLDVQLMGDLVDGFH